MTTRPLIDAIIEGKNSVAGSHLHETMEKIVQNKLIEFKKMVTAKHFPLDLDDNNELLEVFQKSHYHKLVHKESGKIIDSGSLGSMRKKLKVLNRDAPGRHFVGLTSKPVGGNWNEKSRIKTESLDEANVTKMGRTKMIRVRIRSGKVQRRKKVSAVKGYTIRKGKLTRMSATERRRRKLGARRGKIKRKSQRAKIRMKMKRSLRKRQSLGIR